MHLKNVSKAMSVLMSAVMAVGMFPFVVAADEADSEGVTIEGGLNIIEYGKTYKYTVEPGHFVLYNIDAMMGERYEITYECTGSSAFYLEYPGGARDLVPGFSSMEYYELYCQAVDEDEQTPEAHAEYLSNFTRETTLLMDEAGGFCFIQILPSYSEGDNLSYKLTVNKHEHSYDNGCDESCNVCGDLRLVEHTYDDAKDLECNICGNKRNGSKIKEFYDKLVQNGAYVAEENMYAMTSSVDVDGVPVEVKVRSYANSDNVMFDCSFADGKESISFYYEVSSDVLMDKSLAYFVLDGDDMTLLAGDIDVDYDPATTKIGFEYNKFFGNEGGAVKLQQYSAKANAQLPLAMDTINKVIFAQTGFDLYDLAFVNYHLNHTYDNDLDKDCNICGAKREIVTPTPKPTAEPTVTPSKTPTAAPTATEAPKPTVTATPAPTETVAQTKPTAAPTAEPTKAPAATATPAPTEEATPTETPVPTQEAGVGGFVERLYTVAMNRDSDEAGKEYWTEEVKVNGKTGSDLALSFLLSSEFLNKKMSDSELLDVLYETCFGREADEAGKNYWLGEMKSGAKTKEDVIMGFIYSTEWADICLTYGIKSGTDVKPSITITPNEDIKGFAERLYTTCLGRDSEEAGLKYWADEIANLRQSGSEAAKGFFFSEELQKSGIDDAEFLTRLYKTLMGREPEKAGFDYWLGEIKSGRMTRESVFDGFAASPEWVDICADAGILR